MQNKAKEEIRKQGWNMNMEEEKDMEEESGEYENQDEEVDKSVTIEPQKDEVEEEVEKEEEEEPHAKDEDSNQDENIDNFLTIESQKDEKYENQDEEVDKFITIEPQKDEVELEKEEPQTKDEDDNQDESVDNSVTIESQKDEGEEEEEKPQVKDEDDNQDESVDDSVTIEPQKDEMEGEGEEEPQAKCEDEDEDVTGKIEKLEWDEALSVDIPEIDDLQKKMFALLNALIDCKNQGICAKDSSAMVAELTEYSRYYFSKEEEFLSRCGYPEIEAHSKEHRHFIKSIISIRRQVAEDKRNLSYEVIQTLRDWLVVHITRNDHMYMPFVRLNQYIAECRRRK